MADKIRFDPYRNIGTGSGGAAAQVLEEERYRRKKKLKDRSETVSRPHFGAREAGLVSPFAVLGFAAVAVLAVVFLLRCVELSAVSEDVVDLKGQMVELKSEHATLLARYELAYDLSAIESRFTADGSMSRPQPGQMIYVDLTEPDTVVLYEQTETKPAGFWESAEELVGNTLAYFQGGLT